MAPTRNSWTTGPKPFPLSSELTATLKDLEEVISEGETRPSDRYALSISINRVDDAGGEIKLSLTIHVPNDVGEPSAAFISSSKEQSYPSATVTFVYYDSR